MALSRVPGNEELYVGGIFTLRRKNILETTGITHIVSVLKYDFKDFEDWDKYEHLNIDVDDVDDENLLGEFERSGSWIENGLKEGRNGKKGAVLVHCAMGKSRSVTIMIAYLLRQNSEQSVASALELIRESRPIAEPNDGFLAQLELYKEMGCPRDIDAHPKYQRWLYQREVELALAAGMAPDKATPVSQTGPISSLPTDLPPTPLHSACTHHFLHPLSWMRPELEQGLLAGRLECPNSKCRGQLGRYAWQGMRCSCGVWVCPAFSLQKGRVDEVTKKDIAVHQVMGKDGFRTANVNSAETDGIRLPPEMKGKENL
ncbi:Tyrosine-phosphatase yvh1 [Hyphodiscus hymeniophilus]|uniref:protein-tyrosine-phosphatase n=1 Tax=Hyphodiscus hymeniophilus TaxID=353542 RepID=A0A9P6SPU0_9HELO|nr:Tyrosine-phosphatase yvh1 [Hyphodiscus hymeniophilus]